MGKHAYLIMAHNQFDLLGKLIEAIDYELNDIYIHIDVTSKGLNEEVLREHAKKSKVIFVKRLSVVWGGESLIKCEMELFKAAAKGNYQYYHVLSGVDFPIKSQELIHAYFDKNNGMEYIDYWDKPYKEYIFRIKYYYPLQEQIGRYTYDLKTLALRVKSKLFIILQKIKRVDRTKKYDGDFKIGSNWVSITNELVQYLLKQEKTIYEMFGQGVAADELFVQTMAWNSEFKKSIAPQGALRLIDWERGKPYTWIEKDLSEIMNSDKFFVRKMSNQNGLVDLIRQQI